jgi:hypothetical protein
MVRAHDAAWLAAMMNRRARQGGGAHAPLDVRASFSAPRRGCDPLAAAPTAAEAEHWLGTQSESAVTAIPAQRRFPRDRRPADLPQSRLRHEDGAL